MHVPWMSKCDIKQIKIQRQKLKIVMQVGNNAVLISRNEDGILVQVYEIRLKVEPQ